MTLLVSIFLAFLTIGLVSFGGGYAMLPLFERIVVLDNAWLSMERFVDMIAISQVTPGPIAINSATFIGYQTVGVLGAAVATLGVVLIPVTLVLSVAHFDRSFQQSRIVRRVLVGLRPALVGLIMASVFSVATSAIIDWKSVVILGVLLLMLVRVKAHPMVVIVLSGLLGMVVYS